MKDLFAIRMAVKEALRTGIEDIIGEIDTGAFDTVEIACECGKDRHAKLANHCVACGRLLRK